MERISINSDKIALYCRVSTNLQTTDNQKLRLLQYANENKLKYDLFEEVMSTRKTRPVKQALLQKLRCGDYKAVAVFKLDRFARSSRELILDVQDLVERGVGFISLSENLDFSSASGKLHFQILSAFAVFERELIRERTIEGLRRTKQQGTQLGRPTGSKDTKKRKSGGYLLREAQKRKSKDEQSGSFASINKYLK